MSYDVESLITNISVKETINSIVAEIYDKHELKPLCSKLFFKRLLLKLTIECTFIFNTKCYKQTDGGAMGGPPLVVFFNAYMAKLEKDSI